MNSSRSNSFSPRVFVVVFSTGVLIAGVPFELDNHENVTKRSEKLSIREKEKEMVVRQNGGQEIGLQTVFAGGQLVSPKYADLVSPFLARRRAPISLLRH